MGRSRIRKSSSLSSLVTVLLMLDLAGDNGNVPPVRLPVTFLVAAACESSSESEKFTGIFMDFRFGLLSFILCLSLGGFLYDFLLVPGDFLLSLDKLYT